MVSGKENMVKEVNVLVDLPDFGIVTLPLAYTWRIDGNRPGVYVASCKVMLSTENLPEWLYTSTFNITYGQNDDSNASMVSVCTDQESTNRYHEMMLSIVSSYIKLREDSLCLTQQKLSV